MLLQVCASFCSHWWIQTKLQSRNAQFGSISVISLSRVTSKIDRWPCKTLGHLFYATSSFMHHFVAIGEFKLELQFGNAQFGSKSTIALCIISSSYMNSYWSYSPETAKLGYDLCDLDLWPWPFAWTSLLPLVITPENFVMIQWEEHSEKGVTDRQTDRQKEVFLELLGRS